MASRYQHGSSSTLGRLSRRELLKLGLAGMGSAAGLSQSLARPARPKDRPLNVLFIATDDLNAHLGCYGHPLVQSPNLDRLARRGVLFDRAYCQYPLCSPSRSSLLCGRRPDEVRIYDLKAHFRDTVPDVITLPQMFRNSGYYVARVGKIYHYGNPGQIGTDGLDDPASWDEVFNPKGRDKDEEDKVINHSPDRGLGSSFSFLAADGEDSEQTDGMVADQVVRLLEGHRDVPFFIGAGFYKPHCPHIAPRKYFEPYPPDKIELPAFDPATPSRVPEPALGSNPSWPLCGVSKDKAVETLAAYYATISFMDAMVGLLMDALDRLDLLKQTLVVFFSDNGYLVGEHGLWFKMSLFEESLRVPLIFSGPGIARKGQCLRPVELLDLYPTLAELCGLAPPSGLEGASLMPLLRDPAQTWDRLAYSQVFRKEAKGYTVRTQDWRYTEWDQGQNGIELYDHRTDPGEANNLAGQSGSNLVQAELAGLLTQRR